MQNKQTYTVSNLVAKYINTKDDLKVALLQDAINSGISYCGTEYGTGEELLAHLYKDAAGESMNPDVWNALRQYEQDFNITALNKDEYDFLLSHFSEAVEFIVSNRIFTPISEHYDGVTVPMNVLECAIKSVTIKDSAVVYLPNAGYGDAIMLLPNSCNISGFIVGSYTWAIAQVRFYAAGVTPDIVCVKANYEEAYIIPAFPADPTFDLVITNPTYSYHHIKNNDFASILTPVGKAILFTDVYGLSNGLYMDYTEKLSTILQFPARLTNYHSDYHGAPCAIILESSKNNNAIRFVDLSTCKETVELDFIHQSGGRKIHLYQVDLEKSLEILANDLQYCYTIDKSKIDNDILLPAYYGVSRPKIGHSISFVVSLVDTKEATVSGEKPVVTPYDLSEDYSHSRIDVSTLAPVTKMFGWEAKPTYNIVNEPSILVVVSMNKILYGYIDEVPSSGIAISSGITILRPVKDVSFDTAILLLQTDYVKQQLTALTYSLSGKEKKKYFDKIIVWPEVYNDDINDALLLEELEEQARQDALQDELMLEELEEQARQDALQDELMLEELEEQAHQEAIQDELHMKELEEQAHQEHLQDELLMEDMLETSLSMNGPEDIEDSYCIESVVLPGDDCMNIPSECSFEELINALDVPEDERKKLIALTEKGIKEQKQSMQTNLVDSVEKLREENKKLRESYDKKLSESKAAYINEVRMRKHDIRPHLRQIASAERLLSHYLEQDSDIDTMKQHLRNQISRIHDAVKPLSDLVEHLSDEDKFGTPERFNIDKYLNDLPDGDFFTIDYDCDEEMLFQAGFGCHKSHTFINDYFRRKDEGEDLNIVTELLKLKEDSIRLDTYIAPLDFDRLVQNIIENAKRHGFTDPIRRDYNIGIYLTIDRERGMYQIDFSNNGNLLPEGMTKERFGIRGEKAGLTGGTGQGGHIIKSIVEHYGGDFDIFQDETSTVIRIYLPIMR